jgi:hypothetical protein
MPAECKTCNTPVELGDTYCSHSCRVEDEIIHGTPAMRPQAPSVTFTTPDAPVARGGLKFDDGKVPWQLLPFDSLEEIAKVLRHGAKKYTVGSVSGANNWRKGIAYSRLLRAALGHLISWWTGEDLDPETGLSHLAHAGCCVMFLLHYVSAKRSELDDRKDNNA